ncbi:hypothetical protein FOMA001_g19782 [Fusarium oxysporum f. sp. matthiolae]|nr:hypothetical protein FOMA001_g19782 [Fusarium oxysporum f. sp. matthiolae]
MISTGKMSLSYFDVGPHLIEKQSANPCDSKRVQASDLCVVMILCSTSIGIKLMTASIDVIQWDQHGYHERRYWKKRKKKSSQVAEEKVGIETAVAGNVRVAAVP